MDIKKKDFESSLHLNRLYFESLSFKRARDIKEKLQMELELKRTIDALPEDNYKITVELDVLDKENDSVSISLKAIGEFHLENSHELDEDLKQMVISKNTLSIMFPYIRSQISIITTQPEFSPLILPLLNVNALVEKKGEKR